MGGELGHKDAKVHKREILSVSYLRSTALFLIFPKRRVTKDDIQQIFDTTFYSIIGGGLVGGLVGMRDTGDRHILENRDTRYVSAFHAQRHFNNEVLLGFVRYSLKWSAKVALFGLTFT